MVLGVTNDPTDGPVRRFIDQTGVTFDVVREPDFRSYENFFASAEGETRAPYPLDVLIGPDGRLVSNRKEYRPNELAREIERLLPAN